MSTFKKSTTKLHLTRKHIAATKKSYLQARDSTLLKDAGLTLVDYYDKKKNIPFTEDDKKMKENIWGCKKVENQSATPSKRIKISAIKSALSDNICSLSAVGDHIYGIREINNVLGSNSEWNLIPCTHAENVSWKTVTVNGKSKNIITDKFTDEEIKNLDKNKITVGTVTIDSDYDRFTKFKKWEIYVTGRGAKMFYYGRNNFEKNMKKLIHKCLKDLDKNINNYIKNLAINQSLLPIRSIQSANI